MSKELTSAIGVWCSTYPRRVTAHQRECDSPVKIAAQLNNAEGTDIPPFVSVYGFPDGHTTDGAIPAIDTLFIDFDIPSGGEYRSSDPDPQAWYRDMSALLTRVREVCRLLETEGSAKHFRGALSGHKGVHLYLDFPVLDSQEGTMRQFKSGMRTYSDELISYLESETYLDLEPWVDVDSSDLARLCRMPNTLHLGATRAFNEDRYCVPVSIRELANITPNEYVKLTRSPRVVPEDCHRNPSEKAASILTQYIREASSGHSFSSSNYDPKAVKRYEKEQNENITIDDLPFLMHGKPCISGYRDRADKFSYGAASHAMELNVIAHLTAKNVPVDVIVELFSGDDEFDEAYTREQIKKVIAHNYSEFNCETIKEQAPMFCGECDCEYNSEPEIEATRE
ncbi:hypothetical protein [Natronorubrum bangense]|uniref:hypothetical protein n=1 Tax=Natronorubrum bangense TaxID=61858 RepID=UPI000A01494A|nr:hypothetical protein [Natronorubrum bangense]